MRGADHIADCREEYTGNRDCCCGPNCASHGGRYPASNRDCTAECDSARRNSNARHNPDGARLGACGDAAHPALGGGGNSP